MNKLAVSLFIICATLFTTACTNSKNYQDNSIIDLNSSSVISNEESSNTKDIDSSINKQNNISKSSNIIKVPITLMPNNIDGEKNIKYLEINEKSPLQEKIGLIVDAISKECFNSLPINVTLYKEREDIARIELIEPEDVENSRVSWKEDYLNEQIKEQTVGVILKNILQEDYKGKWIESVQLYYEGELISLN